ncbi:MAG: hypothetical protein P9L92_13585 [Candidatus Electryonea clarkiae]|nr:hypothetical protein [Candidatus Electryonea clarkiae]MDP8285650.1 hypothetical protein [Candidatus Electryonea clarkiae]
MSIFQTNIRKTEVNNDSLGEDDNSTEATGNVRKRSARIVTTTPYSIFIRTSPIYRTSSFMNNGLKRKVRSSRKRYTRSLPFRPDPYPYANERWSAHLLKDNSSKIAKSDE